MRKEEDFTEEEIKTIQEAKSEKKAVEYLAWQYGTTTKVIRQIRRKRKREPSKNAEETEDRLTVEEQEKP